MLGAVHQISEELKSLSQDVHFNPTIQVPEIKIPEIKIPEIKVPTSNIFVTVKIPDKLYYVGYTIIGVLCLILALSLKASF